MAFTIIPATDASSSCRANALPLSSVRLSRALGGSCPNNPQSAAVTSAPALDGSLGRLCCGKAPCCPLLAARPAPSKLSLPISFLTPTVDGPAVYLCHTLVSHIALQVFDHTKNVTYRGAFSYNRCCNSRWNAGIKLNHNF